MQFYLIGIKGSGMAALAHLLLDDGYEVTGSDVETYIFTQDRLLKRKVKIQSLQDDSYRCGCFVVVGHNFMDPFLIDQLKKERIPFLEYHKFLDFYLDPRKLVCISGSHGKTTMVGMLSSACDSCSYLRGDGVGSKRRDESFFFLEACEYKDHFLQYRPDFILITNVDYDHVDYFPTEEAYVSSFRRFAEKVPTGLIDYDSSRKIGNPYLFTYGLDERADFYAKEYRFDKEGIRGKFYFQSHFLTDFSFENMFGLPLIEDVVGVLAFYYIHHYDLEKIKKNLSSFVMADKRFNIFPVGEQILIEDYAHHPSQIRVHFQNVSVMYPERIHIAFFRPDRVSRIERFAKEFKEALAQFDAVYILGFRDGKNEACVRKLTGGKIRMIDWNELEEKIREGNRYVFSLMSSKNMDEVKEFVKSRFLNR